MFTVTRVIDGDTFVISPGWMVGDKKGAHVRIAGLNAPELNESGGNVAYQKLQGLIEGQQVELYTRAIDTYGRLVASVHLPNQGDITSFLEGNRTAYL